MPIYEYRCPDCGHEFESMRRISDDPLKECPECGKQEVKKLISRTSFVLKGGGWYKDHYGLKSGSTSTADSGGASSSSSSSDSSSSASSSSASSSSDSGSASAPSGD